VHIDGRTDEKREGRTDERREGRTDLLKLTVNCFLATSETRQKKRRDFKLQIPKSQDTHTVNEHCKECNKELSLTKEGLFKPIRNFGFPVQSAITL
jgi:hypothetical protein